MKKYLIVCLLIVLSASCEKDTSANKFENPKDKEWFIKLQSPCEENTICKLRINKALYEGDTVYFSTYVGALCDMYFTISLLNVHGDTIKNYSGPDDLDSFSNEVEVIETIYRCEDN